MSMQGTPPSGRADLGGGAAIRSLLADRLVAELTSSRVRVLIGKGLPFLEGTGPDLRLVHEGTEPFASGLLQPCCTLDAAARHEVALTSGGCAPIVPSIRREPPSALWVDHVSSSPHLPCRCHARLR